MPKRRSLLKPSGYDVVIRNSNAIKDINAKLGRIASEARRAPLIDEKDRLMREMWQACPHESVCHTDAYQPNARLPAHPYRFCTSCGWDESPKKGRYRTLTRRAGRHISRVGEAGFRDTLRETLRRTGINI